MIYLPKTIKKWWLKINSLFYNDYIIISKNSTNIRIKKVYHNHTRMHCLLLLLLFRSVRVIYIIHTETWSNNRVRLQRSIEIIHKRP